MYKLVIVEDEENIRTSLEKYIPWGQLGFEIAGVFSDGKEAMEFIRNNPCDAVLTDIMMNVMSGLEMTSLLYDSFPMIKVVILSGYSRFDYAQEAIRYRVSAYLLKPVDEEELIRVFQKIKDEIDKERMEMQYAETEEQEIKRVLRQNFATDLTERRLDTKEDLLVYLKLLKIPEICVSCPVLLLKLKIFRESEAEGIEENIKDATYVELKKQFRQGKLFHSIAIDRQKDMFQLMIIGTEPDMKKLQEKTTGELEILMQTLKADMGCDLSYSVINSADRMCDFLRRKSDNAEKMQQPQREDIQIDCYQRVIMEYKLLMVEMNLGNLEVLQHLIDGVFSDLRNNTVSEIRFLMKNMFSSIAMEYEKRRIAIWNIVGERYSLEKLQNQETAEEIETFVRECMFTISSNIQKMDPANDNGIVERIKDYLEGHIGDEIAHEALATKFRIHPGYMSRLFKQTTGETVSGYLFRKRMEKAVELLQDEKYMISEVAEKIGYPNASYFTFMFKKYTGYTPKEFRQRVLS